MPKKSKKSLSKRQSLKDKFKIIRKVKEHNRKLRRNAKKAGKKRKPSLLKDPGIPNHFPYRDEVVKELQFEKVRIAAKRLAQKEARRARQLERNVDKGDRRGDDDMTVEEDERLAALADSVAASQLRHDERVSSGFQATASSSHENSRRAFYKQFKEVVGMSDVVLEVLDARDPLGSRCKDVEAYIRSTGINKKVVLVLNKIDLVPREIAESWLKYFRQELPTVAFKAATKKSGTIAHSRMPKGAVPTTAECLGADSLLQLLKNYVHSTGAKIAITVGVIGAPNVGKSSIINSLKRNKVAAVGNTPGVTTSVQQVHLDKHLRLLDSPGIVFSNRPDEAEGALRNYIKVEKVEDPVAVVATMLQRIPAKYLMRLYCVGKFDDAEDLLRQIATARGKLRKCGTPDLPAAACFVIQDWNDGRLPYYTKPPSRGTSGHNSATLVSSWAAEFDVDAVYTAESKAVIAGLPDQDAADYAHVQPASEVKVDFAALEDEDNGGKTAVGEDDSDMDDLYDDPADAVKGGKDRAIGQSQAEVLYSAAGQHNPAAARAAKKAAQKRRKAAAMHASEAYTFDALAADQAMLE